MDAHGYTLSGNSRSAAPGYIPSLVGFDASAPDRSVYFTRSDFDTQPAITSLSFSRWVNEDDNDPIVAVKTAKGSYYIPLAELIEIAQEGSDIETLELIDALKKGHRQ